MNITTVSSADLVQLHHSLMKLHSDSKVCLEVLDAVAQKAYDAAFVAYTSYAQQDALRPAWYAASEECQAARESLRLVAAHLSDVQAELDRRIASVDA
jgi:hypothetical protein